MKYLNFKLLIFFAALALASPPAWAGTVTDVLTAADFTATNSNYTDFSNVTKNSAAVYAGNSARNGDNIQLRGSSPSGIFTTTSGGKVRSITINFANNTVSGRIVNVYGKNEAYETGSEMYAFSTQGTSLGSAKYTTGQLSYTIDVTDDYQYIAIRSSSGALYLTSISITWEIEGENTNPWIEIKPSSMDINDDGDIFTVSCDNMPDGGLGANVLNTHSTKFSFSTPEGSTFVEGDDYFPLLGDSHALENGTVKVDYTGYALSATGLIDFSSQNQHATAGVNYQYDGDIYIVGNVNEYSWDEPVAGVMMQKNANGTYSAEITANAGNDGKSYLYFTKQIGAANYNVQAGRFGPRCNEDGQAVGGKTWTPNSETLGVYCDLDTANNLNTFKLEPGNYVITIDPAINQFKIEQVAGPKIYNKVVDASQLIAGKNYILVYEAKPAFMGGISTGNSKYGISVTGPTIESNSVNITQFSNIRELTLSGNATDGWSFHNGDGYLTWTGGNSLNVDTEISDNSKWTVTEDFALLNVSDSNRKILYNEGSPRFACYDISNTSMDKTKYGVLYVEDGVEPVLPAVVAPVIAPEEREFAASVEVSMSCATEGATIYYTLDGTDPTTASTEYTEPFTLTATTTVKAIAALGEETTEVVTATFTKTGIETIAAAQALANNANFTFIGDAVVTFHNGNHLYIRDASGSGLIFGANAETEKYNNGDVLTAGWKAKNYTFQTYTPEFTDPSPSPIGSTVNNGPVAPIKLTTIELGDVNKYAKIDNVTITDHNGYNYYYTVNGTNYCLRDAYNLIDTLYVGKRYNVTGVVSIFRTGNQTDGYNYTPQLNLISKELIKENPGLAFNPTSVTVYEGVQNFPEPALTNVTGLPVSYESNNADVATVDEEGNVTIKGVGNATITASVEESTYYTDGSASYDIIVKAKEAAGLSFTAGTVEATYGGTVTAPTLTNDANLPVTYESSDTTVVKVDANGNLTIVGAGNATITASTVGDETHAGGSATYEVHVAKANATMSFTPNAVTIVEGQTFTAPTLSNVAGLAVSYESSNTAVATVDTNGNVTIVGIGSTIITATGAGNDNYNGTSATYTITVEPKPVVAAPTFTPAAGYYNSAQNVTIACETDGADIYYTTDGTDPTTESTKYTAAIPVDENMTIKAIAVKEGYTNSGIAVAEYVIDLPVQIAAPTFMPGTGNYTEAKEVAIACANPDASILYKIGDGEFQPYTKPFVVDQSCTVTAKVTMGGKTVWTDNEASATYTISTLDPVKITDGYYQIKNNGNGKYANVQGRKTMTFTNDIDQQAGTVIRVQSKDNGEVQVLRSQAADLQGYANRAMRYVPEIVQKVVDKLHAEGSGEILGEDGLDAIMQKFDECFDYHLYVEGNLDNCRIYGKTPSMQPVVDFYNENQAKVDAKLPMLVDFINDAIQKVLVKTEGHGASILVPFSLDTIWNRMGGMLIRPVDDESTMAFYHQVLTNKQYVWDFAYQAATFYLEKVQAHPRYEEMKEYLGEFGQYIDKLEQVRPDTKYFIVQNNGKVDYISEGNADIIRNEPWTFWSVEPRSEFKVNFPAENVYGGNYVTTLYTDFAYDLPKSISAYKLTDINEQGYAKMEVLDGTIPAQTPVMLVAEDAGVQTLTLNIAPNALADTTGNQLHGPDYLINKYEIKTPQVQALFNLAKRILGDNFYNNNVAQYEHLMLKTAGTVNNRYFWGITGADLDSCIYIDEEGTERLEVRSLDSGEQGLGFYNNWTVSANKAFLANAEFNPIKLSLRRDINRDGKISIADVTALINILLVLPDKPYLDVYDYEAADVNENGSLQIHDVSALINYLLRRANH